MVNHEIQEEHLEQTKKANQYLFEGLSEDMAEFMDDVRLGRREFGDIQKLKEGD
jgi:hypothetical protein